MKLETQLSLKHEMLEACSHYDPVGQCINVARCFAQVVKSECKEIIDIQSECLEQCLKVIDPRSPLGMQINLTLKKAKDI